MAENKAGTTGAASTSDPAGGTGGENGRDNAGKAETRVGHGTVSEVVEDTLGVGADHPEPTGGQHEGQMDISAQEATFTGFVRMTTRVVMGILVFLIFLALVGT